MDHEDGTVTVNYEVPAGNNECLELSKRITPLVRPAVWNECLTCGLLYYIEHSRLCLAVEFIPRTVMELTSTLATNGTPFS